MGELPEEYDGAWIDFLPPEAKLEWLRQGAAGANPPPEPSGTLPLLSDPELAGYVGLGSNASRRKALQGQLERGQALQSQGQGQYTSILGAALGGLGSIVNTGIGMHQQRKAQRGLDDLTAAEQATRSRFARGAQAWDPAQASNLGILSGDPVLGAYGQSQQKQIQGQDTRGLRGVGLEQARERLNLQKQEGERKVQQFAQKYGLDVEKVRAAIAQGWKGLTLREQGLEADREERDTRRADRKGESSVYGLEIAPGATPTPDDAKIVKGIRAAAATMKSFTSQFYDLYRRNGGSMTGNAGTSMRQLLTSIQLEAKDVAGLGALSGPDQGLMEKLAGSNPTSIVGILRDEFGVDDVGAAIQQLERWVDTKVNAKTKEYGYRVPAAGPARSPPDTDLTQPPGATPAGGAQPGERDRAALQWLRSNPNDPRAPAIRKRLQEQGLNP